MKKSFFFISIVIFCFSIIGCTNIEIETPVESDTVIVVDTIETETRKDFDTTIIIESESVISTETKLPEESTAVETQEIIQRYEYYEESVMLAKLIYREARGIKSITEQANIVWTVLNRVDSKLRYYPDTIKEVITQKNQFAWVSKTPTVDDYGRDLVELAQQIVLFWAYGDDNGIFRTLPADYYYYRGDGRHNHFANDYNLFRSWSKDKTFSGEYDYSLGYLEK